MADTFDELRKTRNDINYYGRDISLEEAKITLDRLENLREELLVILKRDNSVLS